MLNAAELVYIYTQKRASAFLVHSWHPRRALEAAHSARARARKIQDAQLAALILSLAGRSVFVTDDLASSLYPRAARVEREREIYSKRVFSSYVAPRREDAATVERRRERAIFYWHFFFLWLGGAKSSSRLMAKVHSINLALRAEFHQCALTSST